MAFDGNEPRAERTRVVTGSRAPEERIKLVGGRFASPVKVGDVVERRAGPAAVNVHALLTHLRARGVTRVPQVLGTTPDGLERLTYFPGSSGFPPMGADTRSDDALVEAVRLVRQVHDASQDFVAPSHRWHHQEIARPVDVDCIGHLDLAPWNFLFDGTRVVALIDWDTAAPSSRLWDLAYLAYQFTPMHGDEVLPAYGWDEPPDRRHRLELIATTYGGITPAQLLDVVPVRLAATAALMEQQAAQNDDSYALHAEEGHAEGWRLAAAHVIHHRSELLP